MVAAFGLTISLKKTEVMYQKPSKDTYNLHKININGHPLNAVDQFTYLGSIISNDGTMSKDVDHQLAKACSFGLSKNVPGRTANCACYALCCVVLNHGSCTESTSALLELFHQQCCCSIMETQWQDFKTNTEVLEEASLPSIENMLLLCQVRWAGHVLHMDDERLPKAVLYGELCQGK